MVVAVIVAIVLAVAYFFFGTSGDMGYWADSFDPSSPNRSATLWINVYEDYFNSGYCYRHWQLPVRPVCQ